MFWKDILPPCSSVKCKWGREAKVDPLHTIKIYRGNKGTAPLILKIGTRWSQREEKTLLNLTGLESHIIQSTA